MLAHVITLTSFGYLHLHGGPPPQADRVEDVRIRLRDPAVDPMLLELDGLDHRVQDHVARTLGAGELLANLVAHAESPAGPSSIAIGCVIGRHRAPSLTELLARRLRALGHHVKVTHLHVHLPRVLKATP